MPSSVKPKVRIYLDNEMKVSYSLDQFYNHRIPCWIGDRKIKDCKCFWVLYEAAQKVQKL